MVLKERTSAGGVTALTEIDLHFESFRKGPTRNEKVTCCVSHRQGADKVPAPTQEEQFCLQLSGSHSSSPASFPVLEVLH